MALHPAHCCCARGDVQARLTALNLLLGRPAGEPVAPAAALAIQPAPASAAELLEEAQRRQPELAVGRGLVRINPQDRHFTTG